MSEPDYISPDGSVRLYCADCLDVLLTLEAGSVDAVIADPPYGMGKGKWDNQITDWLPSRVAQMGVPLATFCGVRGLRDYPTADWVGAWVRLASTQRNGKFRGFNNWEPILFYGIKRLANDTFAIPNIHDDTGHPTTKPTPLMVKLVERMSVEGQTILDPFMGSGTTGVACIKTGRKFIGIEKERTYFDIAVKRIEQAFADRGIFAEATA